MITHIPGSHISGSQQFANESFSCQAMANKYACINNTSVIVVFYPTKSPLGIVSDD